MRVRWSSACHVVANILKCSKNYFKGVTSDDFSRRKNARAWHWVSRIPWTVRNLCVTDGTTWHAILREQNLCQCEACLTERFVISVWINIDCESVNDVIGRRSGNRTFRPQDVSPPTVDVSPPSAFLCVCCFLEHRNVTDGWTDRIAITISHKCGDTQ